MILVDTNILSTFLKINRVELLFKVFNTSKLHVSSNVFQELKAALERGYGYVEPVFRLIDENRLEIAIPTEEELLLTTRLPPSFGLGELDSIAICQSRNSVFLSNEKRVMNYCKRNRIQCFDLADILAALWNFSILDKEEVRSLMQEIEEKDNVYIVSKDRLFK